jgi:hypothetical protein
MKKIIEIAGWIGTAFILSAFLLNVLEIFSQTDFIYLLMNLLGASLVAWNVLIKKSYSAFTLEFIWASIALFSIVKNLL